MLSNQATVSVRWPPISCGASSGRARFVRNSYPQPVLSLELGFEVDPLEIIAEHAPDPRVPHEIGPDAVLDFKYAFQRVSVVLRVVAPRDPIGLRRLIENAG